MLGIAVMGCGVVGSGTVRMLTQNADRLFLATGEDIRLRTVLDIREVPVPDGVMFTRTFEDVLNDADIHIAVETIGGLRAAYDYTKRMLESGRHVVTSNKELVAEKGDELCAVAREHGVRYLYEAAVGGAIPVLRPIGLCLAGNRVNAIESVVNGSTNYILTRMEASGTSFSAALEEARGLGYVEGNPSADVDGHDARRKLAILAHEAFGSRFADQQSIPFDGIRNVFDGDIRAAALFGGRIKLIARASLQGDNWNGCVRPMFVCSGHPLYAVNDVFNAVLLRTDFADETMLVGRGAGSMPTASAVVGDIIDVARNGYVFLPRPEAAPAFRPDEITARWLVRLMPGCPISVSGETRADGDIIACLTKPMSESELVAALAGCEHGLCFPAL